MWLNRTLVKWPRVSASGGVRLYHSTTGQIAVAAGAAVTGADGFITLDAFTGDKGTDASAVADYFKPLNAWLVKQNKGEKCGW